MDAAPELDFAPMDFDCLRCGQSASMRFRGLCDECRATLRATVRGEGRAVEVADYEPKMNVTPNAVALKE